MAVVLLAYQGDKKDLACVAALYNEISQLYV